MFQGLTVDIGAADDASDTVDGSVVDIGLEESMPRATVVHVPLRTILVMLAVVLLLGTILGCLVGPDTSHAPSAPRGATSGGSVSRTNPDASVPEDL